MRKIRYFRHCVFLIAALSESHSAVIGLSHMAEIGTNSFSIDQEFAASGGGTGRDYTGFAFTALSPTSFQFDGSFLDEGASVFFVAADDGFSEAEILGGSVTELTYGVVYDLPQFFYLGVRTPALDVDFGSYEPAYGWGLFQNLGGLLQLVDHAVAYNADGIVVGTPNAIEKPVPTSITSVSYETGALHLELAGSGGLTASALMGSIDLVVFDIDLVPHTILTEIAPGRYSAVIDTSSIGRRLFVKVDPSR